MGHSLQALFSPTALVLCLIVVIAIAIICGVMPGYIYTRIPVTYAYRRYTENKRQWKLGHFIRTVHADNFLCLSAYRYRPPVSGIDKLPHWLRILKMCSTFLCPEPKQ